MKSLIIANWKCNPTTLREAEFLFNSVKRGVKNIKNVGVVICPPFIYLPELKIKVVEAKPHLPPRLRSANKELRIKLGGQSCFWEEKGAYTGEISPKMLKNLGVEYVIIGHSERRALGENDEMISKKIRAALKSRLKPILCIDKISQIKKDFKREIIIAYEPLFAIGTGKPCSPEKAKKMRRLIKKKLNVPVLYGGSVNSQNAKDYIEKAGFEGLLVGGASLNAKEFIKLVKSVIKY